MDGFPNASTAPSDELRRNELRDTMTNVAGSVAALTVDVGDRVLGVTISSLISVSLEPPLILFALRRSSSMLVHLQAARFAVTVLAEEQATVASTLAAPSRPPVPDHWVYRATLDEASRLRGGAAWLDCRHETSYSAGDHTIVIARVLRSGRSDRLPLLYHRRSYRAIAEARQTAPRS